MPPVESWEDEEEVGVVSLVLMLTTYTQFTARGSVTRRLRQQRRAILYLGTYTYNARTSADS